MIHNEETLQEKLLGTLNEKQREAVLTDSKRTLVLAGAGSGKTKTLIQRILFLIFDQGVPPENILAITFTKNAANEMIDRLLFFADKTGKYKIDIEDKRKTDDQKRIIRNQYIRHHKWISGIQIKTFHAYCYSLLKHHGAAVFDNKFKLLLGKNKYSSTSDISENPDMPKQIIYRVLREISSDADILLKIKQYVLDYYVNNETNIKKRNNYQDDLKYITLNGTKVRSKSERLIADWLYRHGIEFEYEKTINLADFSFSPDFYLPEADLYIEHVSDLSHPLKDKEIQFEKAGKKFVKTHESQTHNIYEFFSILESKISCEFTRKLEAPSLLEFEEEFKTIQNSLNIFIEQGLLRAIDMIKVEALNFQEVVEKGIQSKHRRIKEFYEILELVYYSYNRYCTEYSYLDFNDLIIKALDLLEKDTQIHKSIQNKVNYILVDEFQDVNNLQVELIKRLITEDTNLFCVGDDWQSIYGFRGSEVDYIINFHKHFDNAKIIKLDINYRSNDTIVKASSYLIEHNKNIVQKKIKAFNNKGSKISLYLAQAEELDGVHRIYDKILQLSKNGYSKEDILLLYRRSSIYREKYANYLKSIKHRFTRKTIHAAKGLEARIVFIVGLTGGMYGFPFMMESDLIFQVIKRVQPDLLREEERRLFYVALTRAKEQLFLISELGLESDFIKEIKDDYFDRDNFMSLSFSNEILICNNCGFEMQSNFNFCPICGKSFTNKNYEISESTDIVKETELDYKKEQKEILSKIIQYNDENIRYALECMQSLDHEAGRTFLANILTGSKQIIEKNPQIEDSEYFGLFKNYDKNQMIRFIDKLINNGYLVKDEGNNRLNLPLIKITEKGKEFLE